MMADLQRLNGLVSHVKHQVQLFRHRNVRVRSIAADLYERPDEFIAIVDTPGAHDGDVQVRYLDDRIMVRIERFRDHHEGYDMVVPGRPLTTIGEIDLPERSSIEPTTASATLRHDGTLRIRLPRTSEEETNGESAEAVEP